MTGWARPSYSRQSTGRTTDLVCTSLHFKVLISSPKVSINELCAVTHIHLVCRWAHSFLSISGHTKIHTPNEHCIFMNYFTSFYSVKCAKIKILVSNWLKFIVSLMKALLKEGLPNDVRSDLLKEPVTHWNIILPQIILVHPIAIHNVYYAQIQWIAFFLCKNPTSWWKDSDNF